MAKQKPKKSGEELFMEYYSDLYGDRFQQLKESLVLESDYFSFQYMAGVVIPDCFIYEARCFYICKE